MDIDIIRELIPLLQQAGEGGSKLFVLWILASHVLPAVAWCAGVLGVVWLGCRTISRSIATDEALREIRDIVHPHRYGMLGWSETKELVRKIRDNYPKA